MDSHTGIEESAADERMSISVDEKSLPGVVIFRLEGRLDIFTYLDLKRRMEPFLASAQGKCWLIDLSSVPFVASSGWSVLIATRSRLKLLDCRLGLIGLAPNLLRIYQSMNMASMVPTYATLAEARLQMAV